MATNVTCFTTITTSWPLPMPRRISKLSRPNRSVRAAAKRDGSDSGGLVDEGMVVLQKRIREARMAEANYEPPPHWAEWEKQYYARYDSDVLEAVRVLQTFLMSTRPAVAVGVAALLTASVPTAAVLIWLRLAEAVGPVLSGLH